MVSNAASLILAEAEAKGSNLHDLADYEMCIRDRDIIDGAGNAGKDVIDGAGDAGKDVIDGAGDAGKDVICLLYTSRCV